MNSTIEYAIDGVVHSIVMPDWLVFLLIMVVILYAWRR